ncbi:MAG: hypothetical protein AAB421_02395 [Patescibacteria group bacterium]
MRRFILLSLCLVFLVVPVGVGAQGDLTGGAPSQIVPVECDGPNCGFCHLVQLGSNLLNTGIVIAVILSALTFAYAGLMYMTSTTMGGGDAGKAGKARKVLSSVAMGLVVILGAWLGVDTLMKTLVDEQKFGPWNSIGCNASRVGSFAAPPGSLR